MCLARAREHYALGEFDSALEEIQVAEKKAKTVSKANMLDCYLLKSQVYVEKGDFIETKHWSEKALKLSQSLGSSEAEIEACLLMARALVELGNTAKCDELLDQCQNMLVDKSIQDSISVPLAKEASLSQVRARAHIRRKECTLAIECLKISTEMSKQIGDDLGVVWSKILLRQVHVITGEDLDGTLKRLNEALNAAETLGNKLAISCTLGLIGAVHSQKGELDDALSFNKRALSLREELGSKLGIAEMMGSVGSVYTRKGAFSDALDCFEKTLDITDMLDNSLEAVNAHNTIGAINLSLGDLDQALQSFQKALVMIEEFDDPTLLAWILNNTGVVHQSRGELKKAEEFYQKSLRIKLRIGAIGDIANGYNNLGEVLQLQGELDAALEYYHRSFALKSQTADSEQAALTLKNIGDIHRYRGEHEEALDCYTQSLDRRQQMGNDVHTSETLLALVILSVENNNVDAASKHLAMIHELNEHTPSRLIGQRSKFADAIVLKSNDRPSRKFQAQRLFEQLSQEEVLDHELTVLALLNHFDLLLLELRNSGIEEVINEAKSLSDQLTEIAQNQNSYSLLAETLLLKSRLALVQADVIQAREFLDHAARTAEEKGLRNIAVKVSNQQDELLDQTARLAKLNTSDTPLADRLDLAQIEEAISSLLSKRGEEAIVVREEPVLLLVLDANTGLCVHSKSFVDEKVEADLNIGGFLSAIDTFIREAFSTTGSVERIKHEQYTLVMKPQGTLRFWYAFKGQSYSALQKLDQFLDISTSIHSLWNAEPNKAPHLSTIENAQLEALADRVFLKADEENASGAT